ncbi:tol-pal system protein YbgF [Chelativorans salis]|uniref:Cell division coordinator CpoB n=1 Tax=Chelativorans salis TaxID=2978478 RepID=A0ABT2LRY1_9HYPH|nr:tol-pal system protein YbgF [Chelativorans sp. EGI FJ00035]MCT7377287.1 tol-pal system protein YbgF [Chelativorans sp. EGI FJ00035]
MQFRTFLTGLSVVAFSLAATVGIGEAGFQPRLSDAPSIGHERRHEAPIILAQASDPRLVGLEEEVRRLNGRVEELNFQLLEMQDQLRRMQEDNEFRFQELEGKRSEATGQEPLERAERPAVPSGDPATGTTSTADTTAPTQGEPPRTLGTLTLDENGNLVSNGTSGPVDLLHGNQDTGNGGSIVAAVPPSDDPDEIYRNAYEFVLSGDYGTAEAGFRQYLERFPDGQHAADASFWLGEALLGQDRHREAAEVFLQANRDHPNAGKAPEMLLKLGVSLAALDQIDVACATFTEIGQRYPQASDALRERVRREQASAGC